MRIVIHVFITFQFSCFSCPRIFSHGWLFRMLFWAIIHTREMHCHLLHQHVRTKLPIATRQEKFGFTRNNNHGSSPIFSSLPGKSQVSGLPGKSQVSGLRSLTLASLRSRVSLASLRSRVSDPSLWQVSRSQVSRWHSHPPRKVRRWRHEVRVVT